MKLHVHILLLVAFRYNSWEGHGGHRAEDQDCGGDGAHSQHQLLSESGLGPQLLPPLLCQVLPGGPCCGLWPQPQRLWLHPQDCHLDSPCCLLSPSPWHCQHLSSHKHPTRNRCSLALTVKASESSVLIPGTSNPSTAVDISSSRLQQSLAWSVSCVSQIHGVQHQQPFWIWCFWNRGCDSSMVCVCVEFMWPASELSVEEGGEKGCFFSHHCQVDCSGTCFMLI